MTTNTTNHLYPVPSNADEDHNAMIKRLEQKQTDLQQKTASLGQTPQSATPAILPQRPAAPAYNTILRAAHAIVEVYLLQFLLARLAFFEAKIRMDTSTQAATDPQSAVKHMESSLRAYEVAQAAYVNAVAGEGLDHGYAIDTVAERTDQRLLGIAVAAIALGEYELALGTFEAGIDQTDVEELTQLVNGLARLLECRKAHAMKTTLDLQLMVGSVVSLALFTGGTVPTSSKRTLSTKTYIKIAIALGGGLALLVPMLIMVLHPELLTTLIVTSSFVLLVAFLLAVLMTEAESKDIVAATAGYAAVPVVFVGTSGSGRNSSYTAGYVGSIVGVWITATVGILVGIVHLAHRLPG